MGPKSDSGIGDSGPGSGTSLGETQRPDSLAGCGEFLQRAARPGALGARAGLRSALGLARRPGPPHTQAPGGQVYYLSGPLF